ncbi:MAG: CoA-binding protein [Balneolales bacterium]|nr:CoA-binding protein [Balneolales bacterium]
MKEQHQQHINYFLSLKRIAIVGLSRKGSPANSIARKFIALGYSVIPIHSHIDKWEGIGCFPTLEQAVEAGNKPEGVFLFTRPELSAVITESCITLGISAVWMHGMMGIDPKFGRGLQQKTGSVDEESAEKAKKAGLVVIAGSCPMQHLEPLDPFHKCLRWINVKSGNL